MSTAEHTNAILRAAGDVLLLLGSEPPRRVPNTPLNASALNASVEQYQKYLDSLELEIMRSNAEARRRAASQSQPTEVPRDPEPAVAPAEETLEPAIQDASKGDALNSDGLGPGLEPDLDAGLNENLDADLFDINNDGLDLFGDTSPQQNFSMEDGFY